MEFAFIILVFVFVVGPVVRGYAKRLSRGHLPLDIGSGDVARLREEVDRLSQDVARLQEEQSFMMKLLGSGEPGPTGEGRPTPRDERIELSAYPLTGEPNGDA
jgi:hypothetical protein